MDNEVPTTPKKLNIWLPLLFSLVLVIGMLIGTKMQHNPPTVATIETTKKADLPPSVMGQGKLEELIRYIEALYVDDVNKDELVKEAIDKILFQLDPHSSYISASQLKSVNDQLEGHFDGIGIEFIVVDDTVMIVKTLADGPAAKAGLMAGDKIVEIEDSLSVGDNIDFEGILSKLKGEKGTKVNVGVKRLAANDILHFSVVRDKIPVKSVEVAYMMDDKTGLIKINRFTANTYQEFMEVAHIEEFQVIELTSHDFGHTHIVHMRFELEYQLESQTLKDIGLEVYVLEDASIVWRSQSITDQLMLAGDS